MKTDRLHRRLLLCATLIALVPPIHAAETGSSRTTGEAYGVLQRLGLLQAPAAPAAAPAPATPSQTDTAAPVNAALAMLSAPAGSTQEPLSTPAAPPASDPLSRAYELLRAKGLLPGGPVTAKPHGAAQRPPRTGVERVVVDKSDRKLILFKEGRPYREYRISLGGMPTGPKLRRGDLRTPEGEYTLDWRNPRSRFYKSIHISYPNETDRQRAAQKGVDPGGNIMIHGEHYLPSLKRTLRRAGTPKDWTEGCIALNNEQMDELWLEVADGTPIEIRP